MTDYASRYPGGVRPPRHFWRRAFAFFIDILAFYLVLGLISIPVYFLTGWNMGVNFGTSTSCALAEPSALTRQVEAEWPLVDGEVRTNQICTLSGLFVPTQRYFLTAVTKTENNATSTRTASTFIDENGNAIPLEPSSGIMPVLFQILTTALFIFVSAKFTAARGRTPAKALMSLRVNDRTNTIASFKSGLVREIMKFLPVILSFATTPLVLANSLPAPQSGEFKDIIRAARNIDFAAFGPSMSLAWIGLAFALIWWFGPFIVWRGQTFYDRIAGCFVVRSDNRATSPATPT